MVLLFLSVVLLRVVQAVGKIPIDVNQMNIDLLSISGHKLYGPKVCTAAGVAVTAVRNQPALCASMLLHTVALNVHAHLPRHPPPGHWCHLHPPPPPRAAGGAGQWRNALCACCCAALHLACSFGYDLACLLQGWEEETAGTGSAGAKR